MYIEKIVNNRKRIKKSENLQVSFSVKDIFLKTE